MRSYETMVIVHPDNAGDKLDAVVNKFTGILSDQGARLLKLDPWGERRLAYPIRKVERGIYLLFFFDATPAALAEFERRMRLDENILRFQTVLYVPGKEPAAPEATQAEAAESEAAAPESPAAAD